MRRLLTVLGGLLNGKKTSPPLHSPRPQDLHVVVPESVGLPLPRAPKEEISVPASINGRDLSTGRL
jgi:hypothetical protein